jgi:GTP-binding protein Era
MLSPADLPPDHKSGFVAVVGRPNVGKSTLLNAFMGQFVAAVSPGPQTTQTKQLAILTTPEAQIIFVDTPGIHQPHNRLGELMDNQSINVIHDADVALVLFDGSAAPTEDDQRAAERLGGMDPAPRAVVAVNKVDRLQDDQAVEDQLAVYRQLVPGAELILAISATRGDNRDELLGAIIERLPSGPRYYPEQTITDRYEREITADLIRAAALELLHDEVPHSIAIRIDEYNERGEDGAYIAATLFVERESQKGIVIGKSGSMIRRLGTLARQGIEAMSGRSVYLELRVKVQPNWRSDDEALRRFGYLSN